jgi:hypothetical protein
MDASAAAAAAIVAIVAAVAGVDEVARLLPPGTSTTLRL